MIAAPMPMTIRVTTRVRTFRSLTLASNSLFEENCLAGSVFQSSKSWLMALWVLAVGSQLREPKPCYRQADTNRVAKRTDRPNATRIEPRWKEVGYSKSVGIALRSGGCRLYATHS